MTDQTNESWLNRNRLAVTVWAIAVAFLLANLMLPTLLFAVSEVVLEILAPLSLGLLAVQPFLLGVWAALGPNSVPSRIGCTTILLGLASGALIAGVRVDQLVSATPTRVNPELYSAVGLLGLTVYMACMVPASLCSAWRLRLAVASHPEGQQNRYRLGDLLLLTAGVGVLLGVVRCGSQFPSLDSEPVGICAATLICSPLVSFTAMLVVVATLAELHWRWLIVAITMPGAACALIAIVFRESSRLGDVLYSFLFFNAGAVSVVLAVCWLLRLAGLRLVRMKRKGGGGGGVWPRPPRTGVMRA